jgi:uncharacterized protein (DUF305 family)
MLDEVIGEPEARRRELLPRGLTLLALIIALCFLAGALGWTLGHGRPPARSSADVGFLYDMVAHHHQAVEMAGIQLFEGEHEEVDHFAEEILRFQSYEIGLMDQMLEEWGYAIEDPPATAMGWMGHAVDPESMPGLATAAELDVLRDGPDTDAAFLALMADHHAAGVAMATAAADAANDGEVRDLARRMAAAQRFEIAELLRTGRMLGLPRVPAGIEVTLYEPITGALVESPPTAHR